MPKRYSTRLIKRSAEGKPLLDKEGNFIPVSRNCANCGVEFHPYVERQNFCSPVCRADHWRRNKGGLGGNKDLSDL
jgi:hypothetical protein